jgi:hypothetical protein
MIENPLCQLPAIVAHFAPQHAACHMSLTRSYIDKYAVIWHINELLVGLVSQSNAKDSHQQRVRACVMNAIHCNRL